MKQMKQEGRLIVLPCKVGDTVYLTDRGKIYSDTVDQIEAVISGDSTECFVWLHFLNFLVLEDFGQCAFLSREEAEASLKAREPK